MKINGKKVIEINKICIFDDKKNCDNCGECNICDLDKNKVCDNCGKCLGEDDYEVRAVQVDEIIEDEDFQEDNTIIEGEALEEDEGDSMELIDDIEGLRELLENKNHLEKYTVEEFPGFIRFKNNKEP